MTDHFNNPGAQIYFSGTQVYNASPAAAWTWYDVNCSAVVGARRAIVLLKVVKDASAGAHSLYTRKNGETTNFLCSPHAGVIEADASTGGYIIGTTDASGILEISVSDATPTWTVTVEAYIV